MMTILYIFCFFCAHEALQWGWSLGQHAYWMKKHQCDPACKEVNCRMAAIAATMASILTAIIAAWMLYIIIYGTGNFLICLLISSAVNISHIHFMALLARCTSMPVECWPLISRWVSKAIIIKYVYKRQ